MLLFTAAPAFADSLAGGAVYFDSAQTLDEVIKLSAQRDNEGIAKLIDSGHIKKRTGDEPDIVVLTTGSTPQSPAEFRFSDGPTTYWTVTRNITGPAKSIPTTTPIPTDSAASQPAPTAAPAPAPTVKHHQSRREVVAPFDDDNGRRIWHQVNGKWKWYPASRKHVVTQ
ncbi:MAG: hypothetical protein JO279_14535 [Verrucomicrobia bacterium]|nr:hypothetical protein [Verrucomicrobiota bacterium]